MPILACLLALVAACVLAASAGAATPDPNPCLTPEIENLRCPDLVMRRPYGLYLDVATRRRRVLLRAANSIDNIGSGPAELRGRRTSPSFMRARQRIYRLDGSTITLRTGARLQFKLAHLGRRWWKFHNAAAFRLYRLDGAGQPLRLVRTGPKVAYCLRDLSRTRARRRGSPRRRAYPACKTDPFVRTATLGTSVGWSDIYPASYPEQWIDVTGLRGCFAYTQVADPANGLYESNEKNNSAHAIVRLPFKAAQRRRGCGGRDIGAKPPRGDDLY